jgi:FMN phosphatase YigB (HAD superfamily)
MFGDSLTTDIAAGRAANVRSVWFNRWGSASPDASLPEIAALEPTGDVMRILSTPSSL